MKKKIMSLALLAFMTFGTISSTFAASDWHHHHHHHHHEHHHHY